MDSARAAIFTSMQLETLRAEEESARMDQAMKSGKFGELLKEMADDAGRNARNIGTPVGGGSGEKSSRPTTGEGGRFIEEFVGNPSGSPEPVEGI